MKILQIVCLIAALLIGAIGGFFIAGAHARKRQQETALVELSSAVSSVRAHLDQEAGRLIGQLNGFARAVSADRDFSMKLFVENDRSAPEVSEIAQRYLEAMDLSFLEVADSSLMLLSCGQFAGATGKKSAAGAVLPDSQALFLFDDVRAERTFGFQARTRFTIAETPLYVIGGRIADTAFLRSLAPGGLIRLILRQGDFSLSTFAVQSMSGLKDNVIIVNDTTYLAASLELPYAGADGPPVLYVLLPQSAGKAPAAR